MSRESVRPGTSAPALSFDVEAVRADFPILARQVFGHPLVYLDSAATSQRPRQVIEAVTHFYEHENSNVHRGVHRLSQEATDSYEGARRKVKEFINAPDLAEVIFVRGTTEAINLVAASFGDQRVGPGDEVLITGLEHHSNIVPWQLLCTRRQASLRVVPIDDSGDVPLDAFQEALGPRTRIAAIAHVSNALGTVNPVRQMIAAAHRAGIPVLVDGAQAAGHMPVDVQALDCDFYAFSGHKMFGPTGIGVLHGKSEHLKVMPPWQGGGDMIRTVTFEKSTWNELPYKFEAGTPDIAGAIGLGAAVDWLGGIDRPAASAHEDGLVRLAIERLLAIGGVRLIGTPRERSGVVSFMVDGVHPHDVGTILDREGIAVRAGHHCAQPVMDRFGLPATARASFACYNTEAEVEALAAGVRRVQEIFG